VLKDQPHSTVAVAEREQLDVAGMLAQLVREVSALRAELHRERGVRSSERRLLSLRAASRRLGIDRSRLGRWIAQGKVRGVQIGEGRGSLRISASELERIERDGVPAPERARAGAVRRVARSRATPPPGLPPLDDF
jgi:hypothetical protein